MAGGFICNLALGIWDLKLDIPHSFFSGRTGEL
jgi:hypothetical protein